MFNLKQLSIQNKLTLAMAVSLSVLVLLSSEYIVNTYYVYKHEKVKHIVHNVELFSNMRAASEGGITQGTLLAIEQQLKRNTIVYFLRAYDEQGRLVALKGNDLSRSTVEPEALNTIFNALQTKNFFYKVEGNYLNIFSKIRGANQKTLYLLVNTELNNIYASIAKDLEFIVLLLLVAIFILLQMTRRIALAILKPIKDLTSGMLAVSKSNNYAVRLTVQTQDELGELTGGFNTLLQEIEHNQLRTRKQQAQIKRLAYVDTLTGVANRRMFFDYLSQAINDAKETGTMVGVIYFDIDDFKRVNDSLGHHAGDDLLKQVSDRIHGCLRLGDAVFKQAATDQTEQSIFARLGGDEFTLVLRDLKSKAALLSIIERLKTAMQRSFTIENYEIMVTLSIGATLYPEDGLSSKELLANADIAMYQAKKIGKDAYRFYDKSMGADALKRLSMTTELKHALLKDQFSLVYQPKLDLKTMEIKGAEALLRWHHPELGHIPPADFIPIAEEAGLIHELGSWVLDRAVRECLQLQHMGFMKFSVSVNVSPKQFQRGDLVDVVGEALAEVGLPANALELELTEGVLIDNHTDNLEALKELKSLGVKLSIDDFGTGYSSLSYLSQFPIDKVKIDHSFVSTMLDNPNAALITDMVITLAHALQIEVIAEGVEKQAHLDYLIQRDCDTAQGFLISEGLPFDRLVEVLSQPAFKLKKQVTS